MPTTWRQFPKGLEDMMTCGTWQTNAKAYIGYRLATGTISAFASCRWPLWPIRVLNVECSCWHVLFFYLRPRLSTFAIKNCNLNERVDSASTHHFEHDSKNLCNCPEQSTGNPLCHCRPMHRKKSSCRRNILLCSHKEHQIHGSFLWKK